jgi:hypothetical protein
MSTLRIDELDGNLFLRSEDSFPSMPDRHGKLGGSGPFSALRPFFEEVVGSLQLDWVACNACRHKLLIAS